MSFGTPPQKDVLIRLLKDIEDIKTIQNHSENRITELENEKENMRQELEKLKNQNASMHNAVFLLEEEKTNLRKAVHKLKLRSDLMSRKMKAMNNKIKATVAATDGSLTSDDELDYLDFDSIAKDFILIGGKDDPLATSHTSPLTDDEGLKHESSKRYFWYLMAQHFADEEAMNTIRTADTFQEAKKAMENIKGFDEKRWKMVRIEMLTKAERQKFQCNAQATAVLMATGHSYIAVASSDKFFGTGWRKQREESMKPMSWDGQNEGGRVLMQLRKHLLKTWKWESDATKLDAESRVRVLRKYNWRRHFKPNGSNGNSRVAQRSK